MGTDIKIMYNIIVAAGMVQLKQRDYYNTSIHRPLTIRIQTERY